MRRTFVIGDIHGGLKALKQVLVRAGVKHEDKLIFLGDYVDGWSESAGVISFLIKLSRKQECIFIKGNHDVWCQKWLHSKTSDSIWLLHGGQSTVENYLKLEYGEIEEHLNFFEQMKDYFIDKENRLFLHAGFSSMHGVKKEPYNSNFYWDRTLWEMSLIMKEAEVDEAAHFYPNRFKHYHEIYIGHTPTTNHNIDVPIHAHKLWNVDTGAAFKGKLTIMDIDTKEYWQSDALPSLYPNEKGRN